MEFRSPYPDYIVLFVTTIVEIIAGSKHTRLVLMHQRDPRTVVMVDRSAGCSAGTSTGHVVQSVMDASLMSIVLSARCLAGARALLYEPGRMCDSCRRQVQLGRRVARASSRCRI